MDKPLRLTLLSDTHGRRFPTGEGDVLLHAGDLTMSGKDMEVRRESQWLKSLPFKKKIAIAGNHDWMAQRDPYLYRLAMTEAGVDYLCDEGVRVGGIQFPEHPSLKVYGSPWQPWFYDWAFNLRRGAPIKAKWDLIPEGIDVLVTHGPPFGILDRAPRLYSGEDMDDAMLEKNSEHVGCQDLLEAVQRIKPKLHVFGHIHADYGWKRVGETLFVNASICSEQYDPTNKPIVVEYQNGKFEVVG